MIKVYVFTFYIIYLLYKQFSMNQIISRYKYIHITFSKDCDVSSKYFKFIVNDFEQHPNVITDVNDLQLLQHHNGSLGTLVLDFNSNSSKLKYSDDNGMQKAMLYKNLYRSQKYTHIISRG